MSKTPRIRIAPTWTARAVKDWDLMLVREPSGETQLNPASAVIINYTIAIGIGEITPENVDEVYMRIAALEAVSGTYLLIDDRPLFITHEDIQMHVGLITEAPSMTLEEFWRKLSRPTHGIPIGEGHLAANGGVTALGAWQGRRSIRPDSTP